MNSNIYYINLDKRTDRKYDFLKQFKSVNYCKDNIIRVQAIEHIIGILGCLSSHIKALKLALKDSYSYAIICEDDFTFRDQKLDLEELLGNLINSKVDWDVMLLSQNCGLISYTIDNNICKIENSQTASGYIIKKTYISTLLSLFEKLFKLTKDYKEKPPHNLCLDIYWKKLQKTDRWYITNPILGYQRMSYSDIAKRITDYKC
tara:strand:+ start:250 stop:861 length:612 start_codon:yes stop_codon:yes gene_type:complete